MTRSSSEASKLQPRPRGALCGAAALISAALAASVAGATPSDAARASCPPPTLQLSQDQALSGAARGIPLRCALAEIASLTGASLHGLLPTEPVSFEFSKAPLTTVLSRLLGSRSYLLSFGSGRLTRVHLLGTDPTRAGDARLAAHGTAPEGSDRPGGKREGLGPSDPSAAEIDELRRSLLEDPNLISRRAAMARLEAMPMPPPTLIASIAQEDFDPTMRKRALELAARQGPPDVLLTSAAEILVRNDPSAEVRAAAEELLRRRADPQSTAP